MCYTNHHSDVAGNSLKEKLNVIFDGAKYIVVHVRFSLGFVYSFIYQQKMDQSGGFLNMDISDLLKTSKQVQNKMRQELSRQTMMSSSYATEKCASTLHTTVPSTYLKNVVAEYLLDNSNLIEKPVARKVQSGIEKSSRQVGIQATQNSSSRKFAISTRKDPVTISKTIDTPRPHSSGKTAKSQNSIAKSGSTNQFEYLKSSFKPSVSTTAMHRFPLQRFAETSKGSVDFAKEHPDLQLDSFSNQTTLFPRRFLKETGSSLSEKESVNLASAEIKPPDAAAKEKPETWNEVLSNNRTTRKPQKILRLKVNVADVEMTKANSAPKVKEQKGLDIISTPDNGLFQIEKATERLLKQQKCNLQSFPVMYIRPEYQVQRVATISICADNPVHNPVVNVKYVEYTHEDRKQEMQGSSPNIEHIPSPHKEAVIHAAVDICQNPVARSEENKFFKALRLTEHSSNSSDTSSPTSTLNSRRQSRVWSSSSASKVQKSSSSTSDNEVDYLIENILSSSDRPQPTTTKEFVKKRPPGREVYVQTDLRSTDATIRPPSPHPLREVYVQTDDTNTAATVFTRPPPTDNKATSPLLSPTTIISETLNKPTHPPTAATTKQGNDNFIADDFISKIFDRILNDVPNALQAFKNRNATLQEAERHPSSQQNQEQAQSHQHQVSRINDTSNAEIEPRLSPVQAGVHGCSHTISEMPPTARSTLNQQPVGDEGTKLLLLQQNPLFVKTINKIKSSAVHDAMSFDEKIKDDRHKCPTDAEIKRAVKIFLDSLALQGRSDGDARKSITKGSGFRRKLALPRSELLSSMRVNKYISSVSSHTSNSGSSSSSSGNEFWRRNKFPPTCGRSRSSTSTTITSSKSKTKSDVTMSPHSQQSSKSTDHSLSEGEVLSIGEV